MNILNPSLQEVLEESLLSDFDDDSVERLFSHLQPHELIGEEAAELFGIFLGGSTSSTFRKNKIHNAVSSADIIAINKLITNINRVKDTVLIGIIMPIPLGFKGNLLKYSKSIIKWRTMVDKHTDEMYTELFLQAARAYTAKDWGMINMNKKPGWKVEGWLKELKAINAQYITSTDRDNAKVGEVFDNKGEIKEVATWLKKGRLDLAKIEKTNSTIERIADVLENIKDANINSSKAATANAAHVITTVAKFATAYATATMTIDNITNSIIKLQIEVAKL